MKVEKIKPVPQYLVKKIKKIDDERNPKPNGFTRFYSYITKNDGELVKVTVAVRNYRKKWLYKQVAVHGVNSDYSLGRDLAYHYIGGYSVGWHDKGAYSTPKWFEDGKWYLCDNNKFEPSSILLNKECLEKSKEFKYSGFENFHGDRIIKFLRLYEEYPQIEYLMKMGLYYLYDKKQILRKLKKDARFRKWIIKNRGDIGYHTYVSAILQAYSKKVPITEMQDYECNKKELVVNPRWKDIKDYFVGDIKNLLTYLAKQSIPLAHYCDYFKACINLGLDTSLPQHRYPHDFRRWHDIRIDEYATLKAEKDKEKKKELYEKFAAIAEKYLPLQQDKNAYIVVIAKSPAELIAEGEKLHHCVGRMGYDQKFAREESLIFFIREKDNADKPFVTMEYSIKRHSVLQCYGEHNHRPAEDVMKFINEKWLPYANRKIKKIAA